MCSSSAKFPAALCGCKFFGGLFYEGQIHAAAAAFMTTKELWFWLFVVVNPRRVK